MSHSHDLKQSVFAYLGTMATLFDFTRQKIAILSDLCQEERLMQPLGALDIFIDEL